MTVSGIVESVEAMVVLIFWGCCCCCCWYLCWVLIQKRREGQLGLRGKVMSGRVEAEGNEKGGYRHDVNRV